MYIWNFGIEFQQSKKIHSENNNKVHYKMEHSDISRTVAKQRKFSANAIFR